MQLAGAKLVHALPAFLAARFTLPTRWALPILGMVEL
jgi:hypothetical protein